MIELTNRENKIIGDREFLINKLSVMNKIQNLFGDVHAKLKSTIQQSDVEFAKEIDVDNGKIFKGENYRMLPYVLLDYPKFFSKTDTFAFRTMYWWGNNFSSTLHLEGKSFEKYRSIILEKLADYFDERIYLCVGNTPWEYHFEKSNYVQLNNDSLHLVKKVNFLKLSQKYPLIEYKQLPNLSNNFLSIILKILSPK